MPPPIDGADQPSRFRDPVPDHSRDVDPVEPFQFLDTRGRGHVDLRQVSADHVDAHEDLALFLQKRADGRTDLLIPFREADLFRPAAHMHVRPGLARRRYAVDRARRFPVHQDDPLVPVRHGGQEFLGDERFAVHAREEFMKAREVPVIRIEPEHARAAIAVKRLQDDVPVFRLERPDRVEIAGDGRRRGEVREVQDQELFGVIPNPERIVDHKRPPGEVVKEVRRRDVAHVEGRILPQPDHVPGAEVHGFLRPERHVVPPHPAKFHPVPPRRDPACLVGQVIGRVEEQLAAPCLRFLGKPERAVGVDVDGADRVHLKGDLEGHGATLR